MTQCSTDQTLKTKLTHSGEAPSKTECGCLHDEVIENGRARTPRTLCSVPVGRRVHVQVWVHMPSDPQSVRLRNAATTTQGSKVREKKKQSTTEHVRHTITKTNSVIQQQT